MGFELICLHQLEWLAPLDEKINHEYLDFFSGEVRRLKLRALLDAQGLGVKLNRDKLAEYSELSKRLGSYPYDQDPLHPGWTPLVPNNRRGDPADARRPEVPF